VSSAFVTLRAHRRRAVPAPAPAALGTVAAVPLPRRPRSSALRAPALTAAAMLLAGCAQGVAGTPVARPTPSATPACTPAPLPERAAAVLVVGLPHVTSIDDALAGEVAALGVGGVFLSEANVEDAEQVRALTAGLRARSPRPLLVSTDEESGRVAITRDIVGAGPSARRLATSRTPAQVREFAAEIGEELAAIGVDVDLAPVADLDDGPSRGIIGDRSFSADPDTASAYALAFARGLDDGGVIPTVKHFPGQGRSTTDTHSASDLVDAALADLRSTDLVPFQAAVDAGAPVVMLNHLSYEVLDPDLPASVSPAAYRLLRDMGFTGVAITDSLGMGAIHSRWDFPEAAVRAIEAGADAALTTDGRQAVRMRDALVDAVRTGRLPEARLDEAAARVAALAGGDAQALTCTAVELPALTDASTGLRATFD
jgi:beta-N-acetylhexosaminidase